VGVEILANSDNVLRAGLTAKHIDIPELLPASGPRIAQCTDGGALLRDAGGAELKLQQSESCFLSDGDGTVTVTGEGGRLRRDCRLS
jgi:mannose-6-phosphate isomerase